MAKDRSLEVLYEKPGTSAWPPALEGAAKFTRPFIPPTGWGFVSGKTILAKASILFVDMIPYGVKILVCLKTAYLFSRPEV